MNPWEYGKTKKSMNPYFKDYAEYLSGYFPNRKIQKISVNAGFSCPNRDGRIGWGGCIYCDNTTFTPSYCFGSRSLQDQIVAGKEFFKKKYPQMDFLVYFQSYTNTDSEGDELKKLYEEALGVDGVKGIVIGTRPDSLSDSVVKVLTEIGERVPVFVELGAETFHDATLNLINRGHEAWATKEAARRLSAAGLHVGLHMIFGLPGETEEMMLSSVKQACGLPVESLKFHHLQVIRGTRMQKLIENNELDVKKFTVDEYLDLCVKIVNIVPRDITIERFLASSPPDKVVSPKWGLKNYEFTNMLLNKLRSINPE